MTNALQNREPHIEHNELIRMPQRETYLTRRAVFDSEEQGER